MICPSCRHTFAKDNQLTPEEYYAINKIPTKKEKEESLPKGELHSVAASVLMKLMYAARMARWDLLRAISHLACFMTSWTPDCDKRLHRIMCYVNSTYGLRQVAWIGDDPFVKAGSIEPHMYADADLGGCYISNRSTSGRHFALEGPSSLFPISAYSKRQGYVSTSQRPRWFLRSTL